MADGKRSKRTACHELIEYTTVVLKDGKLRFLDLTGRATSVSKNGLCFITKYPLKSGYVVEFRNKVLRYRRGIVIWIRNLGGIWMAGTRFIE